MAATGADPRYAGRRLSDRRRGERVAETEHEHEHDEVKKPEVSEQVTKEELVGIMYSERQWVVAPWMKMVFFWCALLMLGALVGYAVDKRVTMRRLTMDSVVEPTPVNNISAPNFVLPEGDSKSAINLGQYKGQWVFINFWATWCPPCRDEMPSMEMLNRRFGNVPEGTPTGDHWSGEKLQMLAITVDEDWNEVNRFFGTTQPSFKVLWDRNKAVSTRQWGTRKFPESYLINPKGEVVAKFVGPRDWYNIGTIQYFEDVLGGKRDPSKSS
jgi:thiol-disulfide isomerase/thioredoxin